MGALKPSRGVSPSSTTSDINAPVSSPAEIGSRSVGRRKKVYMGTHVAADRPDVRNRFSKIQSRLLHTNLVRQLKIQLFKCFEVRLREGRELVHAIEELLYRNLRPDGLRGLVDPLAGLRGDGPGPD